MEIWMTIFKFQNKNVQKTEMVGGFKNNIVVVVK